MSSLTLQLPDSLKDRLTAAARRSRKTPARFVREAIEQRLTTRSARPGDGSSLYEQSRDLCGSVSGGPDDLAANQKHLRDYGSWKR